MDDNTYIFELIERYLANELSQAELKSFEDRLKSDKNLAQKVENQKLTHKAADIYAQLKTKEKVKKQFDLVAKSRNNNRRNMLRIAAAILVLIIAGVALFVPANYSNQALADENFEAYPDRITTMGSSSDEQLATAMKAYNEKDFEKAIDLFSDLPEGITQKDLVQLYLGISMMETNQLENAKTKFQQLIDASSPQADAAEWYLALAFLQNNEIENAKSSLKQIVAQNGFQSKNAAQLLEKLDSPFRKLPWVD